MERVTEPKYRKSRRRSQDDSTDEDIDLSEDFEETPSEELSNLLLK